MSLVSTEASNVTASTNVSSATDDQTGQSKCEKAHKCPHAGCPKEYKQLSGLRYHLLHVRIMSTGIRNPPVLKRFQTGSPEDRSRSIGDATALDGQEVRRAPQPGPASMMHM